MNIRYKVQNSHKSIVSGVLLLLTNFIYGQNCVINKLDSIPFRLKHTGLIGKMYGAMKSNDSPRYQIMLIRSYDQMKMSEAFYVSFDVNGNYKKVSVANDSVFLSETINDTRRYDIEFITKDVMPSDYFISNCQNVISSHKKSVMIFFDQVLGKWIEYTSMDGYMMETLEENKDYLFLNNLYKFIGLVFKDDKLYGSK